jgi:AcrR family transcriptional regulator
VGAERGERADRVLDAAGELLLRVGYRRVTVEDVAERAEIGKGTVYLHWSTREQLFTAVFQRELASASDELVDGIRADPAEVLLHRLARANFRAVSRRPLLTALTLADPEVLGRLAASRTDTGHQAMLNDYVRLLAEHGLVRTDLTVDELAYAWHATLEGFFVAQAHADPADAATAPRRAELLAATVRSAFEPDPLPAVDLVVVAARAIELLTEIGNTHRAQLRSAYE